MNSDYNHPPFEVKFFTKPIDEVVPWVGGYRYYCDQKHNRKFLGTKGKQRELETSRATKKLDSDLSFTRSMTQLFFQDSHPLYRIFSVRGSEGVTVIEVEASWPFGFNLMRGSMHTGFYVFDYRQFGVDQFSAYFKAVASGHKTQRIYNIHYGGPRWDRYETASPLPFEDPARYRKRRLRDRLNAAVMIEYMQRLGLDIDAYLRRDFVRAVEFSIGPGGEKLDKFAEEAELIGSGKAMTSKVKPG